MSETAEADKKVDLLLKPMPPGFRQDEIMSCMRVTKCLPFYRRGPLRLVHRVREAYMFYANRKPSHMSVKFWCGNQGSIGGQRRRGGRGEDNPSLFAIAPDPAVFCATCEGRAVGAGMDGAREIHGRTVLFRPRELSIHWDNEAPPPVKRRVKGPSGL